MREPLNPTTIIVALIGFVSGVGGIAYSFLHDTRSEPCTIASAWLNDAKPNPSIAPADQARLSMAMVRKVLECTK